MKRIKSALLLTAAGGQLSQEVAIIDQLRKRKILEIEEGETYMAGLSWGALNVVALNACFRSVNPISWESFYIDDFLEELCNSKVYIKTDPIHWETLPLRQTFEEFLKVGGFRNLEELPFRSSFPVSCRHNMKTKWIHSKNDKHAHIDLTDLLMAATATPVLFPSQNIQSTNGKNTGIPDCKYMDGSTAGTFKKFKKNLREVVRRNGVFDTLHIVSPMRVNSKDRNLDVVEFVHQNDLDDLISEELDIVRTIVENWSMRSFLGFLKKLETENKRRPIAMSIFVSIPNLPKNYQILDFDNQSLQYQTVTEWFETNPSELSIELSTFLNRYII
jgi:hypothetical protein